MDLKLLEVSNKYYIDNSLKQGQILTASDFIFKCHILVPFINEFPIESDFKLSLQQQLS
jgi:hypothetical protein